MNHHLARGSFGVCLSLILTPGLHGQTASPGPGDQVARLAHVRTLLRAVPLIDGHNDLPWQLRKRSNDLRAINLAVDNRWLKAAGGQTRERIYDLSPIHLAVDNRGLKPAVVTDIPRLRAGGVGGQFWSVYIPTSMNSAEAVKAVLEQIDVVHQM